MESNVQEHLWVPSGLLEGSEQLKIHAQLYKDSKANRDEVLGPGKQFGVAPDLRELAQFLQGSEK